jgi:hypothetical protein
MPRVYPVRTVLAQRIRERRLTLEEFSEQLEVFARENNEVGTVSIRHVQRLAAGQCTSDQLRPATARLLEKYFESPIEELLVSPETKVSDPAGVLDPDGMERLSMASVQPCRTDEAAIEALAAVLVGIRHLEDETSAAAVFSTVQQQQSLADHLAAGVRAQARPAAIGLASEINQYLGWLSIPLGRWDDADRYLDRAAVLAVEVDDPLRLSTALSFQAYARLRTGDLRKADSLSEAAQRDTRVHSGLRTYITYQRAEVLARDNDRASAVRLLTEADRMVGQLPPPEGLPPSGYWYVPAFFIGQRGFVLRALGDIQGARTAALECLATMPTAWRDSEWAIRRRKLAEE